MYFVNGRNEARSIYDLDQQARGTLAVHIEPVLEGLKAGRKRSAAKDLYEKLKKLGEGGLVVSGQVKR